MDWLTTLAELGNTVLPWVATLVVGILGKYVWAKIGSDRIRGILDRATQEIFDAVVEVNQAYVSGIRKGREDGSLTQDEKDAARKMALDVAKSNLGPKGFMRLSRVLGGDEAAKSWATTKIEKAVGVLKVNPS